MAGFRFTSVARTERGLVRKTNQDAFLNDDDRQLWAVADGMGGHSGGEVASARLIETLNGISRPSAANLTTALLAVNQELHGHSEQGACREKMGATLALLWVEQDRFFCLWAGDSRIYRLRGTQLERLTRDHRYVEDLLDLGLVRAGDIEHHPYRNVVTRAIGAELRLDLARTKGKVAVGDVFLLVTDGVSNLCDDDEIRSTLITSPPSCAVEELLATCIARGAPDNLTGVLITVHSAAHDAGGIRG